jgi:predicted transcriptional regulator
MVLIKVMILQLLDSCDKLRFNEIYKQLFKADAVVARELKILVKENLVKKTGSRKEGGIYYSLNRDNKDALFIIESERVMQEALDEIKKQFYNQRKVEK